MHHIDTGTCRDYSFFCFLKSTSDGITAIRAAAAISDHKKVAVLLAAGANPIDETTTSLSALHDAVCGKMA